MSMSPRRSSTAMSRGSSTACSTCWPAGCARVNLPPTTASPAIGDIMTAQRQRPSEVELIDRYFRPLASDTGAFGLADDVAVVPPKAGEDIVLTVDTIAEGVHFFPDDPADAVAAKA